MSRRLPRLCASLLLAAGVTACATVEQPDFVDRPPEELYSEARDLLQDGRFRSAALAFQEVERQHPYSEWAVRGRLMSSYAFYEGEMYIDAIAGLESFIDLHPGNKDIAYAYYLLARSYYDQISDVGRDQEMTLEALNAFEELIRRYPDSDYAKDARLKADLARDHLAGKEMEIGRYYQDRREFVAAINRFRSVIETYQTTTHVPEALHRLTECYLALGVRPEAEKTAAVLGHNYPDNEWYERSFALLNEGSGDGEGRAWLGGLF